MKLQEIAEALGLAVEGDGRQEITGLAGLQDARPGELSFLSNPKYARTLRESRASAVFAPAGVDVGERACLRSSAPYADFGRAIGLLFPQRQPPTGVHPSAVVDPGATLGDDVTVRPNVVIGARTTIGARARLHPNVTIYPDVVIGEDCEIHSGVQIRSNVVLGDRVVVHNGSVIGSDGFGFAFDASGRNVRVPHPSGVRVGHDVEIGANCTIDASHPGHRRREREFVSTWIGDRVHIDNLVHVGHGCQVGEDSTLCAMTALAGGTSIGRNVYMGGNSATAGHLHVGDGSLVGARSGVSSDLEPGSQVLGTPHMTRRDWTRWAVARRKLPDLIRRVRRVESELGIERED